MIMPSKPKPRTARQRFTNSSASTKWLISAGSLAVAITGLAGAWAVAENMVEANRPWAKRAVELTVAQVSSRLDLQEKIQIQKTIFDIKEQAQRQRRPLTAGEVEFIRDLERRLAEIERRK